MNLDIVEENKILRDSGREFAEAEIAPNVMKWDEAQGFSLEIVPKLGELGIMGAIVAPEYDGSGLSYPEYVVMVEELSRVDGAIGLFVAAHNSLCTDHIYLFGSEEQRRRYVPDLATVKKIGGMGYQRGGFRKRCRSNEDHRRKEQGPLCSERFQALYS
jgi:alkylation response protein AidB-like acyl-CoA dehydrogenase